MRIKPRADRRPAEMMASLWPKRLERRAPSRPPMQKKHMAKVKFRARSEAPQLKSEAKGAFKMDQAYRMPAKSMAITPIAR